MLQLATFLENIGVLVDYNCTWYSMNNEHALSPWYLLLYLVQYYSTSMKDAVYRHLHNYCTGIVQSYGTMYRFHATQHPAHAHRTDFHFLKTLQY